MIRVDDIPDDGIVIYDIETDSKYPTYCRLEMISYQLGLNNQPQLVDLTSERDCNRFRRLLRSPEIFKVSYNGINFDDIVLARYGFYVEPKNRHDMILALKTIAPNLPSHSLKFISWYYFGDWHEPQRRLHEWLAHNGKKRHHYFEAPPEILGPYCKHDVRQTANAFRLIWEIVQHPQHWTVYNEMELAMAEPLHEMVLFAGEWLDPSDIRGKIRNLQIERSKLMDEVRSMSHGMIGNPGSSIQVASYLHDQDKIELELSKAGNYLAGKHELVELSSKNPIAERVLKIRDLGKVIQHYENHLDAAVFEGMKRKGIEFVKQWIHQKKFEKNSFEASLPDAKSFDFQSSISKQAMQGSNTYESIPKGYTVSGAKTRRFQSNSQFGINFQNQNKRTKLVQLVPEGWLACWVDSRQIENIVHIWASNDSLRREAYEADVDWNEYVWLTNQVLGTEYTRKDLEEMPSLVNPTWSLYKTYKSTKLAMNFFMGPEKFAQTTGLEKEKAYKLFAQVHKACPALRSIGETLSKQAKEKGFISDPFGHIYGYTSNVQKMVVHLIQGCGTGSVPKAMTIANYRTLHSLDSRVKHYEPSVYNRFTKKYSYGVICGTTHDECAFRISLGLPEKEIVRLVRECLYNMEEKFSPLFDGIPLRAQLAVSLTNAGEQHELDHRKPDFERNLIKWIREGKEVIK
jgi:hypothetical protein